MSGDVGWWGLAASLIMIAAVALLSWRQRLRLERDLAIAVARSLTQMLLVGAAASWIPAYRASSVDPVKTLADS